MEFKNCNVAPEVKDVRKDGLVTIMVSAFGNKDSDGDVIRKGAFSKTIKELGPAGSDRIAHLYQHDIWTPIGRPKSMEERSEGLLVRSYVSDIKNGDYRKMYEQEIVREHSIGFKTLQEQYSEEEKANVITEIKLWEYSMVTFGANPNTPVIEKGEDKTKAIRFAKERMEKCQKALRDGTFTDDTMHLFEVEVKMLTDLIVSLATEPDKTTLKDDEPMFSIEKFNQEFQKRWN